MKKSVMMFGLLACLLTHEQGSAGRPYADLMITNGRVWTVDAQRPEAEAVAVSGDRIVAVGSVEQVKEWQGPHTKVIDAKGKLVLPGFNDSHVHFTGGGMQLDAVQLKDADSPGEFADRIARRAVQTQSGEWMARRAIRSANSPGLSASF